MANLTVHAQAPVAPGGQRVSSHGRFADSRAFQAIKARRDSSDGSLLAVKEIKGHSLNTHLTTGSAPRATA